FGLVMPSLILYFISASGAAVVATLLLGTAAAAAPRYPPAQFGYLDGLPVDKRRTGPEPIHSFIRLGEVADLYASLGSTLACYDWVCRNIAKVADPTEYWQYPGETVERGAGDCEDNAFLLTSLIRNEEEAYAVLGWFVYQYQAWGHCWVTCRQCVFEPTLMEMPTAPWQREEELAAYYIPMLYLNESEISFRSGDAIFNPLLYLRIWGIPSPSWGSGSHTRRHNRQFASGDAELP
ncbi:unnamed protein product, partial [marine sediment metagenome]